jgi:hypothetical protein
LLSLACQRAVVRRLQVRLRNSRRSRPTRLGRGHVVETVTRRSTPTRSRAHAPRSRATPS